MTSSPGNWNILGFLPFIFNLAFAAQTAEIEEFMFQNVAYRPTVYITGICFIQCLAVKYAYLKKDNRVLTE